MSKAASDFKETNVKRAVRAVQRAGLKIGRVELERGKIIIFPDDGENAEASKPSDSLDTWMATRADSA
jgi:hypothetical protein